MIRRLLLGSALLALASILLARGVSGKASFVSIESSADAIVPAIEATPVALSDVKATIAGNEAHTTMQWPGATASFRGGEVKYAAGDARFSYSMRTVTRGATTIVDVRKAEKPQRDGESVLYRHGPVVERYRAVGAELEQLFEIAEQPAGEGDLVITGKARTNLRLTSASADEIRFEKAGANLRIHDAVAIDAEGRRTPVAMGYDAKRKQMSLTVPGAWLASATFPVVVDPLVGSTFAADGGVSAIDCNKLHSAQGGRFLTLGTNWVRFLNSGTGAFDGAAIPTPTAYAADLAYLASANKYCVAYATVVGGDEAINVYLVDATTGVVTGPSTIITWTDGVDLVNWVDGATVAATSNGWVVGIIRNLEDDTDPNTTMVTYYASAVKIDSTGGSPSSELVLRQDTYDWWNETHDWFTYDINSAAVYHNATSSDRFAMTWGDDGDKNGGDTYYYAVFGAVANATAWTVVNDFINEDLSIGWDSDSWAMVSEPFLAGDDTNDEFLYVWERDNYDGYYNVKAKRRQADGGGSAAFFIKGNLGNVTQDFIPQSVVFSPIGDVFFVTWTLTGNLYGSTIDGGTNTITANDLVIANTASAETCDRMAVNTIDSRIFIHMLVGVTPTGQMWEIQSIPGTPGPTITTTTLPDANQGQAYSQQLQKTSGSGTPTWSVVAGTLPTGLSLSTAGLLAGTPSTVQASSFTVQVTDAVASDTQALSLNVVTPPPPPPVITTLTLPNAMSGQVYNVTLTSTGGTGPANWSVVAGVLPDGLNLDMSSGIINGACTIAGSWTFTIELSMGGTDEKDYTIDVTDPSPVDITTLTLPSGQVGVPYSTTLTYTGGYQDGTWAIMGGGLPAGLTLDAATGVISGTPTASGTTSLSVQIGDSYGIDTQLLSLDILPAPPPPPTISTTTMPNAVEGTFYTRTLAYSGGSGAATWSVVAGALPAGVTLDSATGTISGTPTVNGAFPFTVQVAAGGTDTQALTLTVDPVGTVPPPTSGGGGGRKKKKCGGSAGDVGASMIWMVLAAAAVLAVRRK